MPILWGKTAWFAGCAAAGVLAALTYSRGFVWPVYLTVAIAPFIILFIFEVSAALLPEHLRRDLPKVSHASGNLTKLHSEAPRILREYSALLEKFPDCVIDSSRLPAPREQMLEVIRFAWLQTDSTKLRDWLETGWTLLGWFQDGVGQTPINIRRNISKTMPPRQLAALQNERNKWLELVVSEMEALNRGRDLFTKANSRMMASHKDSP